MIKNEAKAQLSKLPKFWKEVIKNIWSGGVFSAWYFSRSNEIRFMLPAISRNLQTEEFEIHILTGRERLTMAFWMIASWMVSTRRSWRFVFHDDGTLLESDANAIIKLLPGSRVLISSESDFHISNALKDYPLTLRCRNLHPMIRKLVDVWIYCSQSHLLAIDTDILFFDNPRRIIDWISESNPPCLFMEDIRDATLLNPVEVLRLFGAPLVPKINAGIVAVPKSIITLDFLEESIGKGQFLERDNWYVEQSLYAIAASVYGRVELLPKEYFMPLEPRCPEFVVARHYMGANRHLFYSEGLPRFQKILRHQSCMKSLPGSER